MKRRMLLLSVLCAHSAHADEPLWPNIGVATADGAYSAEIHGRFLTDAGTGAGEGDVMFRRARLNVTGKIASDFFYKVENDFSIDNFPDGITDAYIGYDFNPRWYVQAGQFKEPFNLENLTTSRFATFMERGLTTAFTPGRRVGAMVGTRDKTPQGAWTAMAGIYDGRIGSLQDTDKTQDIAARVTYAHIPDPAHVLHVGLATTYRTPDNAGNTIRYSTVPESRFAGGNFASTGAITNTDHAMQWGLEGAGVWGPFSLQSEAMRVDVSRDTGFSNATFNGYYLQASYYLTGEHRNYKTDRGIFDRTSPLNPVTDGGWGAWQVAARYSAIDLTDGGITGGMVKDITLGLNWIPQRQVVVMGNIVKVDSSQAGPAGGDDPTLFMLRTQIDF